MEHFKQIVATATPDSALQFRSQAYGADGVCDFLRDVLALANASVDGTRHIVVGVGFDSRGRRQVQPVSDTDFAGKPDYAALVSEHIEPPVRLSYHSVSVDGQQAGIYEIADCQDRPYMMRIDFSEMLRRGDAYMRVNDAAVKMGRRQLETLFQASFQDSVAAQDIEVGFPGHGVFLKELSLACRDLTGLPSAKESEKIDQMIKAQIESQKSGNETIMARLVHARLYGSDDPYVSRSAEELQQEKDDIRSKYAVEDQRYLFGSNAQAIQTVVYNQSNEPIIDATLVLLLPPDDNLHIAERLPGSPDATGSHSPYPVVATLDNSIRITQKIGDIPAGAPVEVFQTPLLVCAGNPLRGRKFGIRYAVLGENLRSPAKGHLRLLFDA